MIQANDEFFDDVFRDVESVKRVDVASDDKLRQVATLANEALELERRVRDAEALAKQYAESHRQIVEEVLPDLMREIGLREFTLDDGTKISVDNEVYAAIPNETKEQCLTWLRDVGFGDLIKNEFKITFNMGEDEFASSVKHMLMTLNQPVNFTQRSTVLPQTLKAFVREQDKKGVDVPDQLFNVHRVSRAKFKRTK